MLYADDDTLELLTTTRLTKMMTVFMITYYEEFGLTALEKKTEAEMLWMEFNCFQLIRRKRVASRELSTSSGLFPFTFKSLSVYFPCQTRWYRRPR